MSYEPPVLPAEPSAEVAYSSAAVDNVPGLLASSFRETFHRFIHSYESDAVLLGCHTFASALLSHDLLAERAAGTRPSALVGTASLSALCGAPEPFRAAVGEAQRAALATPLPERERTELVLLHRAPSALTEPCWLDNVSQPATQPARVVNELFRIYGGKLGNGVLAQSAHAKFRKLCAAHDVFPAQTTSIDFVRQERVSDHAYLAPCYHLALSRHPRLFLPEIIGTTLAYYMVERDPLSGVPVDDATFRECREVVRCLERLSFSPRWPSLERRVLAGFKLELDLEWQFWRLLERELLARSRETAEGRMAALVQRVARFAGEHHHAVAFAGRPLAQWLSEAEHHPLPFVKALGDSHYFDKQDPANSKFLRTLSVDGPMFAIFSKDDGKIIKQFAQSLADHDSQGGALTDVVESPPTVDVSLRDLLRRAGAQEHPARFTVAEERSQSRVELRELFFRLINVDLFPCVLPQARAHAEEVLERAEPFLRDGRAAKYSDATLFAYTPGALERRMEDVYFNKLLKGYRPITEMPPRELVVALQRMLALGSLIDGAWIHKLGKAPQYGSQAAHRMFGIYADEMGYGDMRLNHIMIARRVLDSMDAELPEMATREYAFNETVPEKCYAFLAYQLAISQFPQTFFAEGLGLNLAVEMFGLGQVRLDEIRKLRHYGFDDSYERLHLTIDNAFSGHVKVGVDAIHSYLDEVRRHLGQDGVQKVWRRIWRGYASMAQFVE